MSNKEWLENHLRSLVAEGDLIALNKIIPKLMNVANESSIAKEFSQEGSAKAELDRRTIESTILGNEQYIKDYINDPGYDVTEAIQENQDLREQLEDIQEFQIVELEPFVVIPQRKHQRGHLSSALGGVLTSLELVSQLTYEPMRFIAIARNWIQFLTNELEQMGFSVSLDERTYSIELNRYAVPETESRVSVQIGEVLKEYSIVDKLCKSTHPRYEDMLREQCLIFIRQVQREYPIPESLKNDVRLEPQKISVGVDEFCYQAVAKFNPTVREASEFAYDLASKKITLDSKGSEEIKSLVEQFYKNLNAN